MINKNEQELRKEKETYTLLTPSEQIINTGFIPITVNENKHLEQTPIYIATKPIDFRCATDGLCIYIAEYWNKNPQAGIYVFYNHRRDKIKLLYWDYNGFILLFKRLEKGRFDVAFDDKEQTIQLTHQQLSWLLMGVDWRLMSRAHSIQFNQYA